MQKRTKSRKVTARKSAARQYKMRSAFKDVLRRRKSKRAVLPVAATDMEDLLIGMAIESAAVQRNGTDIENLLYSTTASTADLGYNFGFSVGRAIALRSDGKKSLSTVLDMIGLKDSLYHPFRDQVIITSSPAIRAPLQVKGNVHVYVAGVISGYLSHAANMMVHTRERRCVYNGSSSCQFVSEPMSARPAHAGIGVEAATDAIASAMNSGRFSGQGHEYLRVLAYLPLIDGALQRQMIRMMAIAGKKLGSILGRAHTAVLVSSISNYFGAREHSVDSRGRKTLIRLRYESYNSMQGFVSIGAALIAGFAESTGRDASTTFRTNRDKSYTAVIEALTRRI